MIEPLTMSQEAYVMKVPLLLSDLRRWLARSDITSSKVAALMMVGLGVILYRSERQSYVRQRFSLLMITW